MYAAKIFSLRLSGWVPLYYTNELGSNGIPEEFRKYLQETVTTSGSERTKLNIKEADGILTLLKGEDRGSTISPGTQHGLDHAGHLGKKEEQLCFVDLTEKNFLSEQRRVANWITEKHVRKCAIGGPRESEVPGIQQEAYNFLSGLFTLLQD